MIEDKFLEFLKNLKNEGINMESAPGLLKLNFPELTFSEAKRIVSSEKESNRIGNKLLDKT